MRILAIGDVHSGLKALRQLLERAEVSPNDKLIFLGDYIDGWSDAVPTIDFLMELDATHRCIFIRGNHDELCYNWLKHGKDNPLWTKHGGAATIRSYKNLGATGKQRHIEFYEGLHDYHLDADGRLFLHAGFTNLKGVAHEYFPKTFYWDRTLWEMALALNPELGPGDPYYPKRLTHYKEIFIGHTPVTRIGKTTPQHKANVWNVDTGAAFKGPLSIIDCETKEFWQSDPVHLLYPDETGRN